MEENGSLNTHNQGVVGSCPTGPTDNQAVTFNKCCCFFICIQFAYKSYYLLFLEIHTAIRMDCFAWNH